MTQQITPIEQETIAVKGRVTKADVEALKVVVADLEVQKTVLQQRLDAAYAEWLNAEREWNRHQKLTPGMVAVLKRMADGAVLNAREFSPHGYFWEHHGERETVRKSVYLGLLSREAIAQSEKKGTWLRPYHITDHGRNLIGVSTNG